MPSAALSLLFGCWLFQQQAVLWSTGVWLLWLCLCGLVGWLAAGGMVPPTWRDAWTALFHWSSPKKSLSLDHSPWRQRFFAQISLWLLIAMLGFGWAQVRAYWRLQQALPVACEGQVLPVQLLIIGVPQYDRFGQHIDALIERSLQPRCAMPARVRLHVYAQVFPAIRKPASAELAISTASEAIAAAATGPRLRAGERWRCSVRLKRPHANRNPHGFDVAAWSLAHQVGASGSIVTKAGMQRLTGLAGHPLAWLSYGRAAVAARITQVLGSGRESALVRALVIGDDSQLSPADWQLFLRAGVNHLVSISGVHITMLAALAYLCVQGMWWLWPTLGLRLPSRQAGLLAGAVVATAYSLLAGFSIPTQRTLFMCLTMAGLMACKQQWPFGWVLSVACIVVLIVDPWAVLAPGFWLSFGAVAVLAMALGGRLQPVSGWRAALQAQWVMTCAFMPVLLLMFNQVSVVAPLANLLAIPLVSLVLVPLSIAGALLPWDALLHMAGQLASWLLQGLQLLAVWPWSVWTQATPSALSWLLAMLGVTVMLMPRGWPMRASGVVCCLPLLLPVTSGLQSGQMQATVLDVGQGLSVLIRTAHHQLLYDAGPAYHQGGDAGQRIVLPYLRHLGIQNLDVAVVSHDDNDHAGGMASVLAEVPAGRLLSSLTANASLFQQLALHTGQPMMPRQTCLSGQHWRWDGVDFELLSPLTDADPATKDNDRSCVLRVRSAHGSLLLTGDIEQAAEQRLLAQPEKLAATAMTMPHHGSKTSSSLAFLQAVRPQIAIASVGYRNRFGHPKADVLNRYAHIHTQIYRSDQHGAILLDFLAGQQPRVRAWRQQDPHYWESTLVIQSDAG